MDNRAKEIVEKPEKQMPVLYPMVSIACASSSTTQAQPKNAIAMSARVAATGQKMPPPNEKPSIGRNLRNKTKTIVFDSSGSLKKAKGKKLGMNTAVGVKRGRGRPRKNTQGLTTGKTSQLLPCNLDIKEEPNTDAADSSSDVETPNFQEDEKIDDVDVIDVKPELTTIKVDASTQMESRVPGAGPRINQNATAYEFPTNISNWTITDVERFFRDDGFVQESIQFREQEIDGIALSLMSRENVLKHMGLKLGPGLQIHKIICDLQGRIPE